MVIRRSAMGLFGKRFSFLKLIGLIIAGVVVMLLIFKGQLNAAVAGL